ncbi:MAG: hypothetical protein ACTSVU_03735 [Promethearchaeota archaeon]
MWSLGWIPGAEPSVFANLLLSIIPSNTVDLFFLAFWSTYFKIRIISLAAFTACSCYDAFYILAGQIDPRYSENVEMLTSGLSLQNYWVVNGK